MKIKGNYTITANKEVDVFHRACEEEEEPLPCLHFPTYLKQKVSIQFYRIKNYIIKIISNFHIKSCQHWNLLQ
jgi:hypothetical protein